MAETETRSILVLPLDAARVREWLLKLARGEKVPPPEAWFVHVIWSPAALREVARASDYLTDFNPRAAVALLEGLIAAGDSLAQFP
jgi:hypothetical protein